MSNSTKVQWPVVIAGALVAVVVVLGLVGVALVVTAKPGPPTRSTALLERIAVYREGLGVRVCASQVLHACAVRIGTVQGRDRILGFFPVITVPASCDTQVEDGQRACAARGLPVSYEEPARTAHLVCMAEAGVLDGELRGYARLEDAREATGTDSHRVYLECLEGVANVTFATEGY